MATPIQQMAQPVDLRNLLDAAPVVVFTAFSSAFPTLFSYDALESLAEALRLYRLLKDQPHTTLAMVATEQAIALHAANRSRYDVARDREMLAAIAEAEGNLEEAARLYEQAAAGYAEIALADRTASAIAEAADAWEKAGRQEERLATCARAVELQPAVAMWCRNHADALIANDRLDEAAAQLDIAEQLEPDAPYLALRCAELAKARGDKEEAARWAQEALRRQPDWDEAQQIMEWAQPAASAPPAE